MALQIASQVEPIPGYRLLERLGSGGFGEVWKAEAPGGLHKAIKVLHGDVGSTDMDGSRHAEQELRALKRIQTIRHPYLLSLERYDIVEGRLLIVMELADCNLWDKFREYRSQGMPGIPRGELLRYMEEAAEVLDMMNSQYQLQHLDIKPQNLFLIYNHVKVADFGLVKDLEGMRTNITGGVTPVYAAPETFDNVVTRYCDQYSLAIVYQELLTGVRPFNGSNIQQLLVQHMQGTPNLSPLPVADRPPVMKALAKKPEERFPSCMNFVRALYQSGGDSVGGSYSGGPSLGVRAETPVGGGWGQAPIPATHTTPPLVSAEQPPETPKTELRPRSNDGISFGSVDASIIPQIAPPEVTGNGALLPTVIIGIGRCGLEVLQHFRRQISERYSAFERVPNLRLLFLDTDPEALQFAAGSNTACVLVPGEVVPMHLNRAGHYLKPRRNGRSLIEGWFDPQMLYKIPRHPQTMGIRALGRLAFCDHYRTFAAKLKEHIEACTHPDVLSQADRQTQLGLRTNRPRVYVIAGLGGGTGGGMFLDVAYSVRHRLRILGYSQPDVQGILMLPSVDRSSQRGSGVSNAYASLRELNHYSMPETVYHASHDDREGHINDNQPPFHHFFLFPTAPATGSRPGFGTATDPSSRRAADFLRRELLTPIGRVNDEIRAPSEDFSKGEVVGHVVGQSSFVWPRELILAATSRWLGETLISRWLRTDPNLLRDHVQAWLMERWNREELGPESVLTRLRSECEKVAGQPPETIFVTEAKQYTPRGWFPKEPDQTKVWQTLSKFLELVGHPDEHSMQRRVGKLELTSDQAVERTIRDLAPKFSRLAVTLLDHPDYRVVGAEEVARQLNTLLEGVIQHYSAKANEVSAKAMDSFYLVHSWLNSELAGRKPSPAEIAENLREYPCRRYEAIIYRQVIRVYQSLKTQLVDQSQEIQYCRQRLEEVISRLREVPLELPSGKDNYLLPQGCVSIEKAVASLRETINADDLRALDKKFQKLIEQEYQALHSICMNSVNMIGNLQTLVAEQARLFLNTRLGDTSVAAMFFARFPDADVAAEALQHAYSEAQPPIPCRGLEEAEIALLAVPEPETAEHFAELAAYAMPDVEVPVGVSRDEILIHREQLRLPLTLLPQLGPLAEDAYNAATQTGQAPPHARNDVTKWFEVDDNG